MPAAAQNHTRSSVLFTLITHVKSVLARAIRESHTHILTSNVRMQAPRYEYDQPVYAPEQPMYIKDKPMGAYGMGEPVTEYGGQPTSR